MTAKTKTHYWALTKDKFVISSGTFLECWSALVKAYGERTVKSLDDEGIKISRIK